MRFSFLGLILVSGLGLQACERSCNEETVNRAAAFIDSHQSCEVDADCVIVGDFCEEIPGGFCGQIPLARNAKDSAEWRSIETELSDCAPEKCTVCAAALIPACGNGSCGGRQTQH